MWVDLVRAVRERLHELPDAEARAVTALLRHYTHTGYLDFHWYFRRRNRARAAPFLWALGRLAVPAPEELIVYRGVGYRVWTVPMRA